ncbi:MAG: antibiotic biosynthesis monooxygenase [Dysgonamonadaceae bacterium]|jgi:quinol monooxygenase YgiN|nr:antibiotic biosynthesis monooxygenase [Dysgonamonadaceae bacterium]
MKQISKKGIICSVFCALLLFMSFTSKEAANDETLTIVATVTIKAGYKEDVLKAVKTVVDATRKESGVIFYDVFEDVKNPLNITFIETWKSQSAIDMHNKSAHFNEFIKALEGKATVEANVLRQKF